MAFFECEFPKKIGYNGQTGGPIGGPGFSTIVNKGFSGFEARNRNWAKGRHKYQLDLVGRPYAEYLSVMSYFLAVAGMADSFRFLDITDFQTPGVTGVACSPASGDGANKVFQLQQVYTVGAGAVARQYLRTISKPIMSHLNATVGAGINYNGSALLTDFQGQALSDTVIMYLNGASSPSLNNYTIDATTGLVTFATAPANGVLVTGGCQFHTPVRFDSDDWPAQVRPSNLQGGSGIIDVTGINLIEVLITPGQSQG